MTGIEWTDATWNPTVGCERVSPGCDHCYAFALHDRRHLVNREAAKLMVDADRHQGDWRTALAYARRDGMALPMPAQYDVPFSRVQLMPERLGLPLSWRKPRRVFVDSMADLFHEDVPNAFLDQVFAVMALTPHITYQVLTKRPERMREYLSDGSWDEDEPEEVRNRIRVAMRADALPLTWPLPNVWLGVSGENHEQLDARVRLLQATPAAVRLLSLEPLLEGVNISRFLSGPDCTCLRQWNASPLHTLGCARADGWQQRLWVIVGGESGPRARPCDIAWIRGVVQQCQAAGVPVFVKQLGSHPHTTRKGRVACMAPRWCGVGDWDRRYVLRDRKGGAPAEWPEDIRVREFPGGAKSEEERGKSG